MTVLNDILIQAACYGASMLLILLAVAFLQQGFFWKYIKVRSSFGKLILIKCRSTIRDYFYVGWIEGGFLVFKDKKNGQSFEARISIDPTKGNPFYRCMAILWCDINEEKSSVCNVDYSSVTGFDVKKYSDLMTRCLQQPQHLSQMEKVVIGICCLVALLSIGAIIIAGYDYAILREIQQALPNVCKGVVQAVAVGAK